MGLGFAYILSGYRSGGATQLNLEKFWDVARVWKQLIRVSRTIDTFGHSAGMGADVT